MNKMNMNCMEICINMYKWNWSTKRTCMAGGHGKQNIFKQLYAMDKYAMIQFLNYRESFFYFKRV
jgi:hypothetical protein